MGGSLYGEIIMQLFSTEWNIPFQECSPAFSHKAHPKVQQL